LTRGAGLTSAALQRASAPMDGYEDLRAALRQSGAELARLAQGGSTREEFQAAVARRDAAQQAITRAVRAAAPGLVDALEIDVERVRGLLGARDAVVAYRRYNRSMVSFESSAEEAPPRYASTDNLCAFVVRGVAAGSVDGSDADEDGLTLIDLGPIAPIEEAVTSWRPAAGAGSERGIAATPSTTAPGGLGTLGAERRRLVLDPLLPALGDATRWVVALDDVLHLVPFDALPLAAEAGEEPRLVDERFQVETRCSLVELFLRGAPRVGPGAVVALGGAAFDSDPLGPDADEPALAQAGEAPAAQVALLLRGGAWEHGFVPLANTGLEARELGALFEEVAPESSASVVLEKRKASRASLVELAPRARWLHVATHGWFAPESVKSWSDALESDADGGLAQRMSGAEQVRGMSPMLLCGLALAGANLPGDALGRAPGLITAEEIATLDLTNCELAVFSACETNVGERRAGMGVASLQKALQMAGARSAITSLWKVPDEATRELMLDFYRRAWVEKQPKSRALWAAKMRMRDAQDEAGRPKYTLRDWAGWVLTGEPD